MSEFLMMLEPQAMARWVHVRAQRDRDGRKAARAAQDRALGSAAALDVADRTGEVRAGAGERRRAGQGGGTTGTVARVGAGGPGC